MKTEDLNTQRRDIIDRARYVIQTKLNKFKEKENDSGKPFKCEEKERKKNSEKL